MGYVLLHQEMVGHCGLQEMTGESPPQEIASPSLQAIAGRTQQEIAGLKSGSSSMTPSGDC